MDENRQVALTLAHEDEMKAQEQRASAADVVSRARVYLDFLKGTSDARTIEAARQFSAATQPTG